MAQVLVLTFISLACLCAVVSTVLPSRPTHFDRQEVRAAHWRNMTIRDDPPPAPPPPYVWSDFMYFANQFPSEQYEYAVIAAFIDTMRLATAAAATVQTLQNDNSPPPAGKLGSFLRYFTGFDHPQVLGIMTNVLAVLGLPEAEKQCKILPRLPLLYDDVGNPQRLCLNRPSLRAFMNQGEEPGDSFMVICPYFFQNYRRMDEIECSSLGSSAENGFPERNGMWSSGSVLLHELLHWSDLSQAQIGKMIVDQIVTRPSGAKTKAYGPYYSWQLNKNKLFDPLTNDDNYVYFAQEVFWSSKCPEKSSWQDPPDLRQIYDPGVVEA